MIAAGFRGAGRRLQPGDVARIAAAAGFEAAAVMAVVAVETAGSGFDAAGRPRMLFEPHVFDRLLSALAAAAPNGLPAGQAAASAVLAKARAAGLAYPAWGQQPYPLDSYPRLTAAYALNPEMACQSASWGLGQVLGTNHRVAGYPSALAMAEAACAGEAEQLGMMMAFIKTTGLAAALAAHDWVRFAEGYNGRSEAVQGYHEKLAAAYARAVGMAAAA